MRPRARFAVATAAALILPLAGGGQPLSAQGTAPTTDPAASAPNSGAVRLWNQHAAEALMNPATAPVPGAGQSPTVGSINLAMVQAAVYDAVNTIDGGHQPYLLAASSGSSPASFDAAVATAAHDVLDGLGIGLVPALPQAVRDRLDVLYSETLAAIPDGPAEDGGIAAGAAAATAMLQGRTGDGRYEPFAFAVGAAPGQWRPAPPGFASDPAAWVANVDPFLVDSPSRFRTRGPRALTSGAYARDYDEVRELGAVDSVRSPEQQALVSFYDVNPIPLFNRTFRAISETEGLTLIEDARLLAMVNLASADSLISCWDDKVHWGYWRPVTAIHEGDHDGNPRTVGDPAWQPLIPTPPYPDHPSGYNCSVAAFMHTAVTFFGTDRMDFTVVRKAPAAADVTRHYRRFTDVIDDTIDARVFQGIHFRTADVQGAWIGKQVSRWLERHYFQPV